ncbi:MAG: redoxin domain-containing protein [Gemmataceae bacterium]|nr:redoxin domain-containing protein [Gemmataceae bacterium]
MKGTTIRRYSCGFFAALVAASFVAAQTPAQEKAPSRAKLESKIPNLAFQYPDGKSLALYDLKDKKAIVIVFLSFECPVSNSYSSTLADIAAEFGPHGVAMIGLTVNEEETPADVAKQAQRHNLNFPVFLDARLTAARALAADYTPEVFVLDGDFVLRYRGRIDDSYSERLKKHAVVKEHNLRQVLGELLSGRPISVAATRAVGCPIVREERPLATTGKVTYYRDVAPILQEHCQTCHRPGEVGPFSLLTYKQAVNWAADIKTYTQNRTMPPWKPTKGLPFLNERRLSDRELATLAAWVDGGTPAGDPRDAPPPKHFPDGWQLGTPDLVLTPSGDFTLGPDGRDVYRCFVMPTNLPRDVYVTAVEIRPSNKRVVHHVLLAIDTTGQARALEKRAQLAEANRSEADDTHPGRKARDRGAGYSTNMGFGFIPQGAGLTGWAPGIVPRHLPDGAGMLLPKGADVVMQVHYHRNGRVETDRTQVGLYLAKKEVDKPFYGGVVAGGRGPLGILFSIPPGDPNYKLEGDAWAIADFTIFFIMPHMHLLGKQISLTMTPPDGPTQTLIEIGAWDYNWQETYMLKEPLVVKAGTRFHVEAYYDNSAANPLNPFNPPRRVTFGEQTTNEMCFVFLGGTTDQPILGRRGLPLSPVAGKKAAVNVK